MERIFGCIPDKTDKRDFRFSASEDIISSLPIKIDLRSTTPGIYDQGSLGSCVANAVGAAFQFTQIKQKAQDFIPSRLFIYYNARELINSVDIDSGAHIRDGIKTLYKQGVCRETQWPYIISKFTEKPSNELYTSALDNQVLEYKRIDQDLQQMKACLVSGKPFVFGFLVYTNFQSINTYKTGQVIMPERSEKLLGGHAVMAVGYDDTTECFIVQNSWGTSWGDHGFCYMPYNYLMTLSFDFWTIEKVESTEIVEKKKNWLENIWEDIKNFFKKLFNNYH